MGNEVAIFSAFDDNSQGYEQTPTRTISDLNSDDPRRRWSHDRLGLEVT